MKVTIKKVSTKETDGQYGKSLRYGIQTVEHGDVWMSAFENKYNKEELAALKEGSTANIIVWQKGDFTNFRTMNKTDLLEERVAVLEKLVLNKDAVATPAPAVAPTASDDDNW